MFLAYSSFQEGQMLVYFYKMIANDGQLSANQVFTLTVNDFVVVNHPLPSYLVP